MRPIPLSMMTLYAELLQSLEMGGTRAASIAIKTIKKKKYAYATTKDGDARIERYLGLASEPDVKEQIERMRHAAQRAKSLRTTVTALKNANFPAPSLILGRILEVIANAGLFDRGVTLVGTAAYQTYAPILGHYLPTATYATNDVDLSVAEFTPGNDEEDIEIILKRADPSFEPVWNINDQLPKTFVASNGFAVEILTSLGRGRISPVLVESLKCSAAALSFQEFPARETMKTAALYNTGVLVRVPTPARFAVHKLIVAQRRKSTEAGKKQKDLRQAGEIMDILLETDEGALQDVLDSARSTGKSWSSAINASLRELKRTARHGSPPSPIAQRA